MLKALHQAHLFFFKIMKRLLTILAVILMSASMASAQRHPRPEPPHPHVYEPHHGMGHGPYGGEPNYPRSMGFRIGVTGFDATYQHSFRRDQFLQGDFGIDFGFSVNGRPGARATATYNFIWGRPAWTHRGYWGIYSGPGLTLGYVNDLVSYRIGNERWNPYGNRGDGGFMIALTVQVGLEYTFEFPMTLAFEVRPAFGIHANGRAERDGQVYKGNVGFYDNGLLGFVPTFALRYRF